MLDEGSQPDDVPVSSGSLVRRLVSKYEEATSMDEAYSGPDGMLRWTAILEDYQMNKNETEEEGAIMFEDAEGNWTLTRDDENSERGDAQQVEELVTNILKWGNCVEQRGVPVARPNRLAGAGHWKLSTCGHLNEAIRTAAQRDRKNPVVAATLRRGLRRVIKLDERTPAYIRRWIAQFANNFNSGLGYTLTELLSDFRVCLAKVQIWAKRAGHARETCGKGEFSYETLCFQQGQKLMKDKLKSKAMWINLRAAVNALDDLDMAGSFTALCKSKAVFKDPRCNLETQAADLHGVTSQLKKIKVGIPAAEFKTMCITFLGMAIPTRRSVDEPTLFPLFKVPEHMVEVVTANYGQHTETVKGERLDLLETIIHDETTGKSRKRVYADEILSWFRSTVGGLHHKSCDNDCLSEAIKAGLMYGFHGRLVWDEGGKVLLNDWQNECSNARPCVIKTIKKLKKMVKTFVFKKHEALIAPQRGKTQKKKRTKTIKQSLEATSASGETAPVKTDDDEQLKLLESRIAEVKQDLETISVTDADRKSLSDFLVNNPVSMAPRLLPAHKLITEAILSVSEQPIDRVADIAIKALDSVLPAKLVHFVSCHVELAELTGQNQLPAELTDFFDRLDDARACSHVRANLIFKTLSDACAGMDKVTDEDVGLASFHLRPHVEAIRAHERRLRSTADVIMFWGWLLVKTDEIIDEATDEHEDIAEFIKNISRHWREASGQVGASNQQTKSSNSGDDSSSLTQATAVPQASQDADLKDNVSLATASFLVAEPQSQEKLMALQLLEAKAHAEIVAFLKEGRSYKDIDVLEADHGKSSGLKMVCSSNSALKSLKFIFSGRVTRTRTATSIKIAKAFGIDVFVDDVPDARAVGFWNPAWLVPTVEKTANAVLETKFHEVSIQIPGKLFLNHTVKLRIPYLVVAEHILENHQDGQELVLTKTLTSDQMEAAQACDVKPMNSQSENVMQLLMEKKILRKRAADQQTNLDAGGGGVESEQSTDAAKSVPKRSKIFKHIYV